jgi:hypothetical protein
MAIVSGPTGPGTYVETDPRRLLGGDIPIDVNSNVPGGKGFDFGNLLNQLRGAGRSAANAVASPTGTKITGLAAPALYATGSLMQGDIAQGVGELGGGLVGSQLVSGIASGLEKGGAKGKLLGGAVRLAGGLIGGGVGGGVANAVGGTVANAATALTGGAARNQMTAGTSPGMIPGVGGSGIGFSDADVARYEQLSKITGRSQVDMAREMLPLQEQFRNNETQRAMQVNQQTGQLTGALNRQLYMAQLAQGAQSQAGETVRTMMTAPNPYAQFAFQYRG